MILDNKKGQEGVTLTTILLLILGVVVVVLVILFATGFFDKLDEATDQLPGSLQAAVSACELAGENKLAADYCSTFRKVEIDGKDQYQTCNSAALRKFTNDNKEMTCTVFPNKQDEASYCANQKIKSEVMVGTTSCSGTYT